MKAGFMMHKSLTGRDPYTRQPLIVHYVDGRLNVAGSDYLAGATATLADAIAYVVSNAGFSLGDAVQMATVNPGRFACGRGVLRVGAPADLIRFRWEQDCRRLEMEDVVVQGQNG